MFARPYLTFWVNPASKFTCLFHFSAAVPCSFLADMYTGTDLSVTYCNQVRIQAMTKRHPLPVLSAMCISLMMLHMLPKKAPSSSCRHDRPYQLHRTVINWWWQSMFLAVSSLWGPCVERFMTSLLALRPGNSVNPCPTVL